MSNPSPWPDIAANQKRTGVLKSGIGCAGCEIRGEPPIPNPVRVGYVETISAWICCHCGNNGHWNPEDVIEDPAPEEGIPV